MGQLNRKIAIIGCGPSGILASYFLNKLGYTNIHLYGDINDAQPKTIMVDDIANDVTTSYAHNGYRNSIGKVLDEFGFTRNIIDRQSFQDNKFDNISPNPVTYDLIKFVIHSTIAKCAVNLSIGKHIYGASLQEYKDKYITKDSLFWLDSGGSAQGYGFLDEVTAYHLFRWLRPSTFLTGKLGKDSFTYMVQEGFGTLFKAIYDSLEIKRKINKKAIEVSKNILITEDKKTKHYDDVFVCCPLSCIDTPLKINNKTHITYSRVFSYLFEVKSKISDIRHIIYYLDNINKVMKSKILTLRYNNKRANGTESTCGRHIYSCFGYCETFNENDVKSIIQKELRGYGFDIKTDLYFKIYKYNYRFTEKAIEEGVHLYVSEQQGKGGLYYLGGMLSHWDVDSIYEHSREIVNRFHLNNTSNPIDKIQTFANIQYNKWIDEW